MFQFGEGGSPIKADYQKLTDEILSGMGETRPRLLLHCCCGPCGTYVFEYLCDRFDLTALFFNPNIHPREEYEKRRLALMAAVENFGGRVQIEDCDYEPEQFLSSAEGREGEPEGGARCTECFRLRLTETAKRASEQGFDFFCTTLTVGPGKDAARINELGFGLGERFGVKWLPSDFKKRDGYKRSIELSKAFGLYRQNYCGCTYSRPVPKPIHGG